MTNTDAKISRIDNNNLLIKNIDDEFNKEVVASSLSLSLQSYLFQISLKELLLISIDMNVQFSPTSGHDFPVKFNKGFFYK